MNEYGRLSRRRVLQGGFGGMALGLVGLSGQGLASMSDSSASGSTVMIPLDEDEQRWLDTARREAPLMIYYQSQPDEFAAYAALFKARYGLEIEGWKSATEDITQRVVAEERAKRHLFDLLQLDLRIARLASTGALQPVSAWVGDALPPRVLAGAGLWLAVSAAPLAFVYDTRQVSHGELPSRMEDLQTDGWRGRIAFNSSDWGPDWFRLQHELLGKQAAEEFFEGFIRTGVLVRSGFGALRNGILSGSIPATLHLNARTSSTDQARGAAIGHRLLPPPISSQQAWGVSSRTEKPASIALWLRFLLNDAQVLWRSHNYVPALLPPPEGLPAWDDLLFLSQEGQGPAERREWRRRYDQFLGRAQVPG